MSWKKFLELFRERKVEEHHFILGIDIGNQSSAIAFYNPLSKAPEIIDMSGGYGRPNIPTALQYIHDTREWVFGEYAVLNSVTGSDIPFFGLMEKMGKKEYAEISGRPVSISQIMSLYLKELIGSCRNINPKAEIAGIVASVPSYISEEAKSEFMTAIRAAGFEKSVIELVPDRECIFHMHYYNKPIADETVMLLDFGSREIRGGVYKVTPTGTGASIKSLSSMFDKKTGTQVIDDAVEDFFTEHYAQQQKIDRNKLNESVMSQLSTFAYQHKDLLFQKNRFAKPLKLYYNFAYPPFQRQVTLTDVETLIRPFSSRFTLFLSDTVKKSAVGGEFEKNMIQTVICAGGGFEMFWAREAVQKAFPLANISFFKNPKGVVAEGASLIAAMRLAATPKREFAIEDANQIKEDIGVKVTGSRKEQFIPLIERNAFWWQSQEPKSFIINESTDKPIYIELFKRFESGEVAPIDRLLVDGLPARPAGTTRIKMLLEFESCDRLTATVDDMGFGDLFPVTDYTKQFMISLT